MARPRLEPRSQKFTIRFAPGELERLEQASAAGELSSFIRHAALERAQSAEQLRAWAASLRELAQLAWARALSTPAQRRDALTKIYEEANYLAGRLETQAVRS